MLEITCDISGRELAGTAGPVVAEGKQLLPTDVSEVSSQEPAAYAVLMPVAVTGIALALARITDSFFDSKTHCQANS